MEQMTHVVDYEAWLSAAGVEAYNAFVPRPGSRTEVPHVFTFKLRRDLTGEELIMLQRQGVRGVGDVRQNDVIVLVKTFMSDTALQQAPMCFLPEHRAARVAGVPQACLPTVPPTEEQRDMWLRLAAELDKSSYGLHRAAAFLRRLARPPVAPLNMTDFTWLRQVLPHPHQPLVGPPPVNQHLPEPPWQLRVRYKRI